jgi:hypothetical protein
MRNNYEIRDNCVAIFLNYKGRTLEALVDIGDLPMLLELDVRWYPSYSRDIDSFYIKAHFGYKDGKPLERFLLHRLIMNPPKGLVVDHLNHCPLDNRRLNLRVVTESQNMHNMRLLKTNTTGVKGVSFSKQKNKYEAYIHHGKKINLGLYATLEEAAEAVEKAREKYIG